LSLIFVEPQRRSVQTYYLANPTDDGQVFETFRIDDHSRKIIITGLIVCLAVEAWVNDLQRTDVLVFRDLVWECRIDDDPVHVV